MCIASDVLATWWCHNDPDSTLLELYAPGHQLDCLWFCGQRLKQNHGMKSVLRKSLMQIMHACMHMGRLTCVHASSSQYKCTSVRSAQHCTAVSLESRRRLSLELSCNDTHFSCALQQLSCVSTTSTKMKAKARKAADTVQSLLLLLT